MKRNRGAGFTLIEVMVALAVVALALPAVLVSLYQQVDSTAYLRDKSLARFVASNRLEEFRIIARARQEVFGGENSGEVELAGRQWRWELRSEDTEVEGFRRVEIDVGRGESGGPGEPGEESPLYTLVAFMADDPRERESSPP